MTEARRPHFIAEHKKRGDADLLLENLRSAVHSAYDDEDFEEWDENPFDLFFADVAEMQQYPEEIITWFLGGENTKLILVVFQRFQDAIDRRLQATIPAIIARCNSGAPVHVVADELFRIFSSDFLFQTLCTILLRQDNEGFEQIRSLHLEATSASAISETHKSEMHAIVEENYKKLPGLIEDFASRLENDAASRFQGTTYHLITRDITLPRFDEAEPREIATEIVGFVRVERQERGFYCSTFHMKPELRTSGIGTVFIEQILQDYHPQGDIYAIAEKASAVLEWYINHLHAEVVREMQNSDPTRSAGIKVEICLRQKMGSASSE